MPEQVEEEESADAVQASATSDLSAFAADSEMVADFVTESREYLAAVEQKLLLIEKDASDMESINAIFRALHTIKGLAGFLELKPIQGYRPRSGDAAGSRPRTPAGDNAASGGRAVRGR